VRYRKRQTEQNDGPLRGPGGGKVRPRPQRKATRRRKQGLADYLFLGTIGASATALFEHFVLKAPWALAALAGAAVCVSLVAWSIFLDRRRAAKSAQRPKQR
jgi:hypothetical protein